MSVDWFDHTDSDGDDYAPCAMDCDDGAPLNSPSALELCDGVDNNCDGAVGGARLRGATHPDRSRHGQRREPTNPEQHIRHEAPPEVFGSVGIMGRPALNRLRCRVPRRRRRTRAARHDPVDTLVLAHTRPSLAGLAGDGGRNTLTLEAARGHAVRVLGTPLADRFAVYGDAGGQRRVLVAGEPLGAEAVGVRLLVLVFGPPVFEDRVVRGGPEVFLHAAGRTLGQGPVVDAGGRVGRRIAHALSTVGLVQAGRAGHQVGDDGADRCLRAVAPIAAEALAADVLRPAARLPQVAVVVLHVAGAEALVPGADAAQALVAHRVDVTRIALGAAIGRADAVGQRAGRGRLADEPARTVRRVDLEDVAGLAELRGRTALADLGPAGHDALVAGQPVLTVLGPVAGCPFAGRGQAGPAVAQGVDEAATSHERGEEEAEGLGLRTPEPSCEHGPILGRGQREKPAGRHVPTQPVQKGLVAPGQHGRVASAQGTNSSTMWRAQGPTAVESMYWLPPSAVMPSTMTTTQGDISPLVISASRSSARLGVFARWDLRISKQVLTLFCVRALRRTSEDRQIELTDAALHIIATKGITALSTRSLAAEVGLSTGAIFRHFASLEALLDTVVARVEAVLESTYPPSTLPAVERLERFIEARSTAVGNHLGILRLVLSEQFLLALPESGSVRLAACVQTTRAFVLECVRPRDVEARAVLSTLLALLRSPAVTPTSSRKTSP